MIGDVCKLLVQLQSSCVEKDVVRCLWIVSTLLCKSPKSLDIGDTVVKWKVVSDSLVSP